MATRRLPRWGTLVIRRASVEHFPGTVVQMSDPVVTVPASTRPIFTPSVADPKFRNWRQVGEAIRSSGEAGELLVWAYVDSEGGVRNTRVVRSSGAEAVDRAAESALREVAEFRPALNRDQGSRFGSS
jgi:TonB family protein